MDYISGFVKCPFFCSFQEDRQRIKCEGPVENTTTQLTFVGEKRGYLKTFCCENYKNCRIYKMLIQKY